MAKRPTPQSKVDDPAAAPAAKPRRARAASSRKTAPRAEPVEPVGASASEPSVEDIRRRAYERYLERGGKHGKHFDDWLQAEKELRSKK